ncbi:hypothetical protein SeLEV6574_g08602, partial [Synchytrium endobioticum]
MAATTACSIKATAVMCLLWMVFLSASATGRSSTRCPAAEQAALEEIGTYGNADELLANGNKLLAFKYYIRHMMTHFEAIYANLESKLSPGFYPASKTDLKELRNLQILVTMEKFPWPQTLPEELGFGSIRWKYPKYIVLFENCVSLYRKYMENTAVMIKKAIKKVEESVYADNNLGDDPNMQTIRRIVLNEIEIWGGDPLSWETPAILSQSKELRHLRHRCNRGRLLINLHDEVEFLPCPSSVQFPYQRRFNIE